MIGQVGRRGGVNGSADLRHLPHECHADRAGYPRRGRKDQLDASVADLEKQENDDKNSI